MSIRIKLGQRRVGDRFQSNYRDTGRVLSSVSKQTAQEGARRIKTKGDADIRAGGNFGARWTNSFQAEVTGSRQSWIIRVFSTISYFLIHEYGGTIMGKPLLWIPLPWNKTKKRARDFGQPLFRVDREGKNPLLMVKRGKKAEAMYVGVKSVKLKRRFHIRRIIQETARQMPAIYRGFIRAARRR
jgi:hypothetical protein